MQPIQLSRRLRSMKSILISPMFNDMKNNSKVFALFLLLMVSTFSLAITKPFGNSNPKTRIEMYFLRGDVVEAGKLLTAELSSNTAVEVDLVIENEKGDQFGEKHIVIENGSKLIRFKVTEIPSGIYYIKLVHGLREQRYAFTVK